MEFRPELSPSHLFVQSVRVWHIAFSAHTMEEEYGSSLHQYTDDGSTTTDGSDPQIGIRRKHIREDTLDEFLVCPSCDKHLITPYTLPCLHSFCMTCLKANHQSQRRVQEDLLRARDEELSMSGVSTHEDVQSFSIAGLQANYHCISMDSTYEEERGVATQSRYFRCPLDTCRGLTTIPLSNPERLKDLEVNEPLCNIQHTLSMKCDLPRGRVKCRSCGTRVAIGVCCNKDCNNQPYCGHCLKFHLSDNRAHSIVYPDGTAPSGAENGVGGAESRGAHEDTPKPISSPGSGTGSEHAHIEIEEDTGSVQYRNRGGFSNLKQCDILCKFEGHERFFRNLYCEDHQKVICLACTASGGKHRRCEDIVGTGDKYEEGVATTERKLTEMEKMHDYFKAAIKTTEEVKRALEDKVDKVKESIEDRYNMIIEQLTAHRDDLLSKCDTIYRHKTEELEQHLVILNRVAEKCKHSINYSTKIKDWAIASEFMMLKRQIDRRLNDLTGRYSKYRCETNEDDCIFLEENNDFSTVNAIGRVFSTPSVKNFKISAITPLPTARQSFYLSVTIHDSVGNKLLCHSMMPKLQATIRHVEDDEVTQGYVDRDSSKGCYNVMLYPGRTGHHELCIFQPLNPPYDRYIVGGKKYIIDIEA